METKLAYKLSLVFEPQPEGGYAVTCPILPELITEGDTVAEALANAAVGYNWGRSRRDHRSLRGPGPSPATCAGASDARPGDPLLD